MAKQMHLSAFFKSNVNSENKKRNDEEKSRENNVTTENKDMVMTEEKLKNWPLDEEFQFWDTPRGKVSLL